MALTTAFAKNGNKKAVPQTTQDGSVSYDQGFGNLYALPPEEGGLFIDRAQFNQIMYDTTSAVISNQNSISTLNSKVTANQNSINTLNSKVADLESGVSTGVVNLTGNQTIQGVKTFSSPPVSATNPTNNNQVANKAYVDTVANTAVKLTGNQTIAGTKTFSSPVVVPDATATTHAVNLAQLNTKANWNAVVNLTDNQTIAGVKTFSSIPISATQPTNANQVANKAYVDTVAAKKANFITATVKVGASETIKNLNEFKTFAQTNFAHSYNILITSDIEETSELGLRGLAIGFSNTEYTITFKQNAIFQSCKVGFGKIGLKIDPRALARITFLSSEVHINQDVDITLTDLIPASVDITRQPAAIWFYGSRLSTGGNNNWNITSTARDLIGITHSYLGLRENTFTGSLASGKTLFSFAQQGILMSQSCVFNNLSVASIAQNQLTNKGIWFNV